MVPGPRDYAQLQGLQQGHRHLVRRLHFSGDAQQPANFPRKTLYPFFLVTIDTPAIWSSLMMINKIAMHGYIYVYTPVSLTLGSVIYMQIGISWNLKAIDALCF